MTNCNKCSNILILKQFTKKEHYECRGCNLGVISNCECYYYDVIQDEYWCEKCNIQLYKCNNCNNYYDNLIKNTCINCIEIIKNNNPSYDDNIYVFDEEYLKWKLIKRKYICKICNNIKYYNNDHRNFTYNNDNKYICINCELDCKLKKIKHNNNDYEFKIKEYEKYDEIFFKKLCICKKYTDWIPINYIDGYNDIFIQCENCNPSTNLKIYDYKNVSHIWDLDKIGKKCNLCDNILFKNVNQYFGDIIQCINCKPVNDYIKFKFINTGYKIDKVKIFNGNKHVWKNPENNINIDYKCSCNKCSTK